MEKEEKKSPVLTSQFLDQVFADTAKCVSNVRYALIAGKLIHFGVNHCVCGVHYDLFSGDPFFEVFDSTNKGFSSIPVRLVVINKESDFYKELFEAVISFVVPVNDFNDE